MHYGMTYEQFWYGDPWRAKYYREAYIVRRKEENTRDWLQGAYFYNAISTALANAFRKKGQKAQNYLEEPFRIFKMTTEEKQAKMEQEKAAAENWMRAMEAQQHQRKMAQEQQNGEA